MTDYEQAKKSGFTSLDRSGNGIDHHTMSKRLVEFLSAHDFHDYGDYFGWKIGRDGYNGETLMHQMDAFFETLNAFMK